jgi:Ca2+-binding EF-hand superfamily protein
MLARQASGSEQIGVAGGAGTHRFQGRDPAMADTSKYLPTFQLIDTDDDGLISAAELRSLMCALGAEADEDVAVAMVRAMDGDSDGLVSLEELSEYLSSHPL